MNNSIFDALRAELGHADPLCPYVTVERLCLELVLTQSARGNLYRITGVDLTQIDSLDVRIAQTLMSEVGLDSSGRLRTCIWMCGGPAPRSASATCLEKVKPPAERVLHIDHMFARMQRLNTYEAKTNAKTRIGSNLSQVLPPPFMCE